MGLSGRPIGGAPVILRYATRLRPGHAVQASAVSDGEGRFAFAGLPADAVEARVAAWAPGQALATPAEGLPAPIHPGAPRLLAVLEPRSILRVTFKVPSGAPPAEGALGLDAGGGWIPFAASEAVLTDLPPGRVGVKWHSEAYGGGVFFVEAGRSAPKDTAVVLSRPEWVEGVALDPSGAPAAGVLYRAENAFRGMAAATGEDGSFRIRRARAGALQIHFRDPRFRDTVLALGRDAGKRPRELPIELRLDHGAEPIAGAVVPAGGDPRACLVTARPADSRKTAAGARARWPGGEIRRAVPDADGAFSLGGLEEETYRVRVECPASNLREDTAAPGARLLAAVGPAAGLSGLVTAKAGGAPLAGAAVAVSGARPGSPEAALADATLRADSTGRFALYPRFEGDSWLCASAPGFAPACRQVAAGDTLPAALALERSVSLRVRVLAAGAADTSALPGARVRLRRAAPGAVGRASSWTGESDEAGSFAAEGLARGEYQLDVRGEGRLPFRRLLRLDGDLALDAALPEGRALEGTLYQADGRPARDFRVLARPEWPEGPLCPAGIVEAPLGPDGAYRLPGLGACPVTLGLAAPWSRRAPFLPLWRKDGLRPGGGPLAITLPPARAWEITAVSGGLPIPREAEIHVLLAPEPGGPGGEALGHPLGKASFRGAYVVKAFAGMRYVAVVSARGYRERADTVTIPPGEDAFETRLELAAWPELRGRVAFEAADTLSPLRRGGFAVRGPGGASAPVAADGSFLLPGLPPAPAALELRDAEGRLAWSGTGSPVGPEIVIRPGGPWVEVAGVAVDARGLPVAGAAIRLRRREAPEASERAVADGAGRFRARLPAGAWLACPEDGRLPCTRLRPDLPGGPARVACAASPRNAQVTFALPLPLPLKGAAALMGPAGPIPPSDGRDGDQLEASAAFMSLPEGALRLHAAAYSPSPAILWWAAEVLEGAALEATAGPGISVSARDAEGRPLAGVGIRFLPRGSRAGRLVPDRAGTGKSSAGRAWGEAEGWRPPAAVLSGTDSAGSLHCLGVRPGRYWIYASHRTHACAPLAWELARPMAAAVPLVLEPGSPIRVKAVHGGYAAAGARADVFDSLGNRAAPAVEASRDGGLLECGAFPPGAYQVAVSAPGLGRLVRAAAVDRGVEANLEAVLPAAGWLEVVGEGLDGRAFHLKDSSGQVSPLARQAELPPLDPSGRPGGSLLYHGVLPGRYMLWIEGGTRPLAEVEIRPAELSVADVGRLEKVRVALPGRRG